MGIPAALCGRVPSPPDSYTMTLKSTALGVGLGFALVLGGCDSLIEVEPRQSVTPDDALSTLSGFEALINGAYDALQDDGYYGNNYILYPDALADNIQPSPQTSNRIPNVANNVAFSHLNRWAPHYTVINDMNLVLNRIGGYTLDPNETEATKNRVTGEAYFFRAMNYFDLARTKGYEPGREVNGFNLSAVLRLEPTLTADDADLRARSTNTEVYQQIFSDLNQAQAVLGAGRGKRFVTPAAIEALRARVNLYASNWAAADAAATAALAASPANLVVAPTEAQLLAAWRAGTFAESIFEIEMTASQDGASTNVNQSLQSLTDPRVPNFFDAAATASLVAAHETGDARLGLYAPRTIGGTAIRFIQKYTGTTAIYVDRIPVFRVAEMLLIQAEARAEQGNTAGALQSLNTLRAARGLGALSDLSSSDIVSAVLRERRVELAFEGHRFFDLKRRGLDIPKPQSGGGVLPYTDYRILAPIPETQVALNPDLVQNPGYGN